MGLSFVWNLVQLVFTMLSGWLSILGSLGLDGIEGLLGLLGLGA